MGFFAEKGSTRNGNVLRVEVVSKQALWKFMAPIGHGRASICSLEPSWFYCILLKTG